MKKKLIIFGTGELASIAFDLFKSETDFEIVSFTADKKFIKKDNFNNLPLLPFEEIQNKFNSKNFNMHVALSYREINKLREKKFFEAKKKGYILESFISDKSNISDYA